MAKENFASPAMDSLLACEQFKLDDELLGLTPDRKAELTFKKLPPLVGRLACFRLSPKSERRGRWAVKLSRNSIKPFWLKLKVETDFPL